MTLNEKIKIVRDALNTTSGPVYHYRKDQKAGNRYIVWQEDRDDSIMYASNGRSERSIHGTIDLFTLTEYDELADQLETALETASRITYRLNAVMYEDDTNFIHYEWEFWVV